MIFKEERERIESKFINVSSPSVASPTAAISSDLLAASEESGRQAHSQLEVGSRRNNRYLRLTSRDISEMLNSNLNKDKSCFSGYTTVSLSNSNAPANIATDKLIYTNSAPCQPYASSQTQSLLAPSTKMSFADSLIKHKSASSGVSRDANEDALFQPRPPVENVHVMNTYVNSATSGKDVPGSRQLKTLSTVLPMSSPSCGSASGAASSLGSAPGRKKSLEYMTVSVPFSSQPHRTTSSTYASNSYSDNRPALSAYVPPKAFPPSMTPGTAAPYVLEGKPPLDPKAVRSKVYNEASVLPLKAPSALGDTMRQKLDYSRYTAPNRERETATAPSSSSSYVKSYSDRTLDSYFRGESGANSAYAAVPLTKYHTPAMDTYYAGDRDRKYERDRLYQFTSPVITRGPAKNSRNIALSEGSNKRVFPLDKSSPSMGGRSTTTPQTRTHSRLAPLPHHSSHRY